MKLLNIEKIKEVLDDTSISAYSIEQKTGISRNAISRYRQGKADFENLTLATLMKIAEVYIDGEEDELLPNKNH